MEWVDAISPRLPRGRGARHAGPEDASSSLDQAVRSGMIHAGMGRCFMGTRLAGSVHQVRRHQMGLGPTESDTGCGWFLLSSGCDRSRYYRVTHGTALIPNETQLPCRTLVAMGVAMVSRQACPRARRSGAGGPENL